MLGIPYIAIQYNLIIVTRTLSNFILEDPINSSVSLPTNFEKLCIEQPLITYNMIAQRTPQLEGNH